MPTCSPARSGGESAHHRGFLKHKMEEYEQLKKVIEELKHEAEQKGFLEDVRE